MKNTTRDLKNLSGSDMPPKKRAPKLYWVETPSPEENCFVAAHSRRSAAKYEEDGTGFGLGDCVAQLVMPLNPNWIARKYANKGYPAYIQFEDVNQLGIKWNVIEGDDVFTYGSRKYVKQGDINYIASLTRRSKKIVIRSVLDLMELIARDAPGDWVFRGHASCRWRLQASVHRLIDERKLDMDQATSFERGVLSEFKRRARMLLPTRPASEWEWMILAQHFGLPTRILDWTENPLVALYFAVANTNEISDDGMLYAYRHGAGEIDLGASSDPFAIERIELVRPPHLDRRVIAQQSIFTAEPPPRGEETAKGQTAGRTGRNEADLRYWYVSVNYKSKIRNELVKLGISESSLFPGLASLAAEIRRAALTNSEM